MERLKVDLTDEYDSVEAAIHVGRYALALPFANGRRVLDVACGEGYGAWLLAQAGAAEVAAVDVAESAIARAKALFPHECLAYSVGDAERLDEVFPASHFDLVVSIETIEHLEDPERYLRALRLVAAEDAIIVVTCPNDYWYYDRHDGNPMHRRKFTWAEFRALTQEILGAQVQWLLGSATLGFAAVPWPGKAAAPGVPPVVDVAPMPSTLRVPAGTRGPAPETSSYFVGIWNAGAATAVGGGALLPLSMDVYRDMTSGFTAFQELTRLRKVDDELRITRVQAAALRREADILAGGVRDLPALRARVAELEHALAGAIGSLAPAVAATNPGLAEQLAWHVERVRHLDEALAWHVARVGSLDESLAWHVDRVRALEQERDAVRAEAEAWRRLRERIDRMLPVGLRRMSHSLGRRLATG